MCLQVDANGYSSGKGTHVSVYACLMRGKHDNQLQWPFEGKLIFDLLNWREDKEHKEHAFNFNRNLGSRVCARVTAPGEFGVGLGNSQFIPHSFLSYNSTTNTEYLQDDCLRLRVKTVTVYSK